MKKRQSGIVYFLATPNFSKIKVGATRNKKTLKGRIRNARWKFKANFRVVDSIRCRDVYAVENAFHLKFGCHQVESEVLGSLTGNFFRYRNQFFLYLGAREFVKSLSRRVNDFGIGYSMPFGEEI